MLCHEAIAASTGLGCSGEVPFLSLLLSGACTPSQAWLISRGARVSPFHQSVILNDVRQWKIRQATKKQFVIDVITMIPAAWRTK
jgi:hypothetical protein